MHYFATNSMQVFVILIIWDMNLPFCLVAEIDRTIAKIKMTVYIAIMDLS